MSDNPYNSLGQILSHGGEIALARAISRGWSSSKIDSLFAKRFEPIRGEDREALMDFSERGLEAGRFVTMRNTPDAMWKAEWKSIHESMVDKILSNDDDWLEEIPINPNLYGDEPNGRRFHYVGVLIGDDGKEMFTVRGDLADALSDADIIEDANRQAHKNKNDSPRSFKGITLEDIDEATIHIVFLERRF